MIGHDTSFSQAYEHLVRVILHRFGISPMLDWAVTPRPRSYYVDTNFVWYVVCAPTYLLSI